MVSKPSQPRKVLGALALTALLALSVFTSVALAEKLPPENTALPVVSPTTPTIGKAATTTNGTWKNEPTSYTYAWLRCSTAGTECVSISGATSSSYTVTEADAGHTLVSAVTAKNAFGSTTAQSKPTGKIVLPTQYWYACQKGAGGGLTNAYSDPACTVEVAKGIYGWKKLTESTITMKKAAAPLSVEWTFGGISMAVACTPSGEGFVANPAGGGAGTEGVGSFNLKECALTQPASQVSKCGVIGAIFSLNGQATELEGKPALRFDESTEFTLQIVPGGEPPCAVSGYYKFSGAFSGVSNSTTSSLEFSKAGSSLLLGGSYPAWLSGSIKIETKAGEPLKLAS